ncbi:hypothetical protein [Chryseosolibacter indicus]|uniref:Integral membrane protein n=1 Tax=Chryseosolibacter indicus TaxID=2782351 RepID=A0ABS5VRP2_9BACT|nr:hypothetical protein [Chryseosolibacter indicus]MBT1704113.1 hypothetical protein [Chryseosolibacter indicus]
MEIAGLILYLLITGYITLYVGQVLFKNGRHFLIQMLVREDLTNAVNRILLTGYYLVNLGYVFIMLTNHPPMRTLHHLISALSTSVGTIMLTLGTMHFFNIAVVILWNKLNNTKRVTI